MADRESSDFTTPQLTLSGAPGIIDVKEHADLPEEAQAVENRFKEFLREVVLPRRLERGWRPLFGAWLSAFDQVIRTDEYKRLYRFLFELYRVIGKTEEFPGILLLANDEVVLNLNGHTFIVRQPGEPYLEFFWERATQRVMFGKLCDQLREKHRICLKMVTDPAAYLQYVQEINIEYFWVQVVEQFFEVVKSIRYLNIIELLENDYLRRFEPKEEGGTTVPEFVVVDQEEAKIWWDEQVVIAWPKEQEGAKAQRFDLTDPSHVKSFAETLKPCAQSLFESLPRTREQFYLAVMDNYPEA